MPAAAQGTIAAPSSLPQANPQPPFTPRTIHSLLNDVNGLEPGLLRGVDSVEKYSNRRGQRQPTRQEDANKADENTHNP